MSDTVPVTGVPECRQGSVQCLTGLQLHRMHYLDWGAPDNPRVVVCVHGLTRNARDFDELARELAGDFRVICPDVAGRGLSDWLQVPAFYAVPEYARHMTVLLARLGVDKVSWVGTSMGGLIGMFLSALDHSPVRRLVLNDVGPVLDAPALIRIAEYVGHAPSFASLEEAEAHIRQISAGFGELSDSAWRALTTSSVMLADGRWHMRYDPAIGDALRSTLQTLDTNLWFGYERISCPTFVLRGEHSDLLSRETLAAMAQRGPCAKTVEIAATGHAPMLMKGNEIGLVRDFLLEGDA